MTEPRQTLDADSAAGDPKIPFGARFSLIRQRIILTVRWWFRLPIDEIRERGTQAQIENLQAIGDKSLETIRTLTGIISQLQARLAYHEANIPRMRQLKAKYDLEQQRLRQSANGQVQQERLEHGIVGEIRQ